MIDKVFVSNVQAGFVCRPAGDMESRQAYERDDYRRPEINARFQAAKLQDCGNHVSCLLYVRYRATSSLRMRRYTVKSAGVRHIKVL